MTRETGTTREHAKSDQISLQEVVKRVKEGVPPEIKGADDAELERRQKGLADLPYFSGREIFPLLTRSSEKSDGMEMVRTETIVGTPAFRDWSTEYDSRKGRGVSVAKDLVKGTEQSVDHVFHVNSPDHGIKLKKFSGPGGDICFVKDGSHRVAGCKLAELQELPATVEDMTEVSGAITDDIMMKTQWESRIKQGFIKGDIEEDESGESYKLNIQDQVLPWASFSQRKMVEMNRMYNDLYPGSLKGLELSDGKGEIPEKALMDEIAMNYFVAGRWDEYEEKFGDGK